MNNIALSGTATIIMVLAACRHPPSTAEPTPILVVFPDPDLHQSSVIDEERAALDVGSIRVCITENWVRVRFGAKEMLLDPVPVSVRLSERGKRRIVFGSEAPAAERTCALLDARSGEYDVWIAGDGPTPITLRRGYIDSLAATVTLPVGLPDQSRTF
jgi:hypothetical protein